MKKTLTLRTTSERADAPALQRKGRGWAITESRLDRLHDMAREMRRNPTPAQTALADALDAAELGRFRFRRQQVIGSAIVDFACPPMKLAVELVEEGADLALEGRRDASLALVGVKILRYPASEALEDPHGLADTIVSEMRVRWNDLQRTSRPKRAYGQSSGRSYQR